MLESICQYPETEGRAVELPRKKAKTSSIRFTPDGSHWGKQFGGRDTAPLSSYDGNVPIARIVYREGTRDDVADLARRAKQGFGSQIADIEVSNRAIVILVYNNGMMSRTDANALRSLFLAELRSLAEGGQGRSSTERRNGNQPVTARARTHRDAAGRQRHFSPRD